MPTSDSTVRHQQASLKTAHRWGDTWTSADLEFLAACPEIPVAELAAALGRTVYAVSCARTTLADDRPRAAATSRRKPARPAQTWTFIGDDVPPGW